MPDEDRVLPRRALGFEILQGAEGPGRQPHDDDEVEHTEQAQGDVGQRPHDRQGQDGAGEGRSREHNAQNLLGAALASQEVDVDLRVGIAAQHGGEDENEDERDHGPGGPSTEVLDDGLLGQDRTDEAVVAGPVGVGGQQDDQARSSAYENRVDEHTEGLDEALFDRVGDGGGAGGVGDGAQAGLVGEQPAAHTVDDGGRHAAGDSVQGLVGPESPANDLGQDSREVGEIE